MPAILTPRNIGRYGSGPYFGFETVDTGGSIMSYKRGIRRNVTGLGFFDSLKIFGKKALPFLLNFIPRKITDYIVASTPLLEQIVSKERYAKIKPFLTQLKTIQSTRKTLDSLVSPTGPDTAIIKNPLAQILGAPVVQKGLPDVSGLELVPSKEAIAREKMAKMKLAAQEGAGGSMTLAQALRKVTKKGRISKL